jgi:hypothetical protein
MKRDLIGLASLAMIAMQKRNRGGLSVSYDFSMLDDYNFNLRPLARYKKKYPRVRVMPKYMKGFDLHVFWFPFKKESIRINGTITDAGNRPLVGPSFIFKSFASPQAEAIQKGIEDGIYKNFELFYQHAFKRQIKFTPTKIVGDRIDYRWQTFVSSNRDNDLTEEQLRVLHTIKEVSQNPNHKILIINSDRNPEQLTPIMMLHDLCEVITQWIENGLEGGFTKIVKGEVVRYRVPILPKTPTIERWLNKPSLWKKTLDDGYGLEPIFGDYRDSDLLADCFAQKMATGKLEWLTVENSPAFRAFYEHQYSNADEVIFPSSYEPFIQGVNEAIDRALEAVKSAQIFVLN